MKKHFSEQALPLIAVIGGAIGFLLRLALYMLEESTGLLPKGHILHIASIVLSIAIAVLMLIFVRRANAPIVHKPQVAASGAFFAGLWMLPAAFGILEQADSPMDLLWALLSFASIPCLMLTAWRHFKGRTPHFFTNVILCLFFVANMICQYPLWCGNPQLADYLLPLLACVFLSLAAYQRTALDQQAGSYRKLLFFDLMAGFFCICSMAGNGERRFYLAGALWALTNLYAIQQEEPHVSA